MLDDSDYSLADLVKADELGQNSVNEGPEFGKNWQHRVDCAFCCLTAQAVKRRTKVPEQLQRVADLFNVLIGEREETLFFILPLVNQSLNLLIHRD